MVTIVGDTVAVSQQVEDNLREGGATVQRVSGSLGEVVAALTSRIAAGRPLV
jgi:putative cell wall-binding protein